MPLGPLMIDLVSHQITPQEQQWLAHPAVGGVILFTRNFQSRQQLIDLVDELHAIKSPSLLVAVDQEGGRVQRFQDDFTIFPPMRTLGKLFDKSPAHALEISSLFAWQLASELRECGIDLSFTPILDLATLDSRVIGDRAFHCEPQAVCSLAKAFMQGLNKGGMQAIGKHFPGHGTVVADSHVECPVDHRVFEEIANRDLKPFTQMIAAGMLGIMSAHVVYPCKDSVPASFSSIWLNDILRQHYGFKGVIFSDDLSMLGAHVVGDIEQRIEKALQASSDMILICNQSQDIPRALEYLEEYENKVSAKRLELFHGQQAISMSASQQQTLYDFLQQQ